MSKRFRYWFRCATVATLTAVITFNPAWAGRGLRGLFGKRAGCSTVTCCEPAPCPTECCVPEPYACEMATVECAPVVEPTCPIVECPIVASSDCCGTSAVLDMSTVVEPAPQMPAEIQGDTLHTTPMEQAPAEEPSVPELNSSAAEQPPAPKADESPSVLDASPSDSKSEVPAEPTSPTEPEKPATTNDLFGTPVEPEAPAATEPAPAGPADNDLFGTPTPSEPTPPPTEPASDLFGTPAETAPAAPADDLFGTPSEPAPPTNDLFGAPAEFAPPANDLFGTPAEQAPPANDLFGAPPEGAAPANDLFGTPEPAAPATPPADDLFGTPSATNQADPATDLFGTPAGDATQPAVPAVEDVFGTPPAGASEDPAASLFGQPTSTESSPYGDLNDLFGTPSADAAEKAPTAVEPASDAPSFDPFKSTRTWHDNTGHFQVDAKLVAIYSDSVRLLKANGKFCTLPVRRLSESDKNFVEHVAKLLPAEDIKFVSASR